MKIKTYVVPTLSEAIAKIKRDLGPGAVILSTRKATGQTPWFRFGRAKLEVTAAVDQQSISNFTTQKNGAGHEKAIELATRISQMTKDDDGLARIKGIKEGIDKLNQKNEKQKTTTEIISDETQTRQITETAVTDFFSPIRVNFDRITQLNEKGEDIIKLSRRLLWHQVDADIVQECADYLLTQAHQTSLSVSDIAANWLIKQLPQTQPLQITKETPRILAVVGPTGSGKTTTLAKLASHLSLEKKVSVAFISLDHFRIGASEQLSQYAEILKAPCVHVHNQQELLLSLKRFSDSDYVLIDTVGRSPKDENGISEIAGEINIGQPMWTSLVLPATLKNPELSTVMKQFTITGINNIIMTKLDEAISYGSLFNAAYQSRNPLSYFTTGQQVPEDIEEATQERVVDCLLNFSGHFPVPSIDHPQEYVSVKSVEEKL